MKLLKNIENIFILFFIYLAAGLIIIISIIIICILYVIYLFNYNKINKINIEMIDLLYKIIKKYGLQYEWLDIEGKQILITERKSNISGSIPLLFVHGTFSSSANFYELISMIPPEYHCVCMDLPNFGISSNMNIEGKGILKICKIYGDLIGKVIKKKGFQKVNIVAHSLGSIFSIYTYKLYPNLFNEFLILNPPGVYPTGGICGYYSGIFFKYIFPQDLLQINFLNKLQKAVLNYYDKHDELTQFWILFCFNQKANGSNILKKFIQFKNLHAYWTKAFLHEYFQIKCKTHVWYGSESYFDEKIQGELLNIIAPHISVKIFEKIGHNLYKSYDVFINELTKTINPTKLNNEVIECKLSKKKIKKIKKLATSGKYGKSYPSIRQTSSSVNHLIYKIKSIIGI